MQNENLEALINSLPKQIKNEVLVMIFTKGKTYIGYSYLNNFNEDLSLSQLKGESLTDLVKRFTKLLKDWGVA